MRVVDHVLDRLDSDRGVLLVRADTLSMALKGLENVLSLRARGKGEVICEEIVVPVHVRDSEHL
jgi:hypothetical protein